MDIHLIRHGKTLANEKRLFCGSTDVPLSPAGMEELERLIARNIYPSADMFFTSGLLRARQTASLIYGDTPKTQLSDLNEYDFGLFEMKSYDELKNRADFQAWISDQAGVTVCPQGESGLIFKQRVMRGFNTVLDEAHRAGKKSALAVCHGGVIVRIMEWLFPDTRNFYEWQPEPGRGYTIIYDSENFYTYREI